MNLTRRILALIAVLVVGIIAGYLIGSSNPGFQKGTPAIGNADSPLQSRKSQNSIPISEVGDRVAEFINAELLKPGIVAEVSKAYETDSFYAFDLRFLAGEEVVGNDTVYVTKDGRFLILKLYELPDEVKTEQKEARLEIDIKNEPFKGDENANITIIEFSGYSCPFCAKFARETLPRILKNFSVKFVFKDYPVHGEVTAHEAANCAMEQGKYWEYHDMLFERQKEWVNNVSKLYDYAKILGLDVDKFNACVSSGKHRDEVLADKEEGVALGVTGTPTFFINRKKVVGALPYEEFERILKELS